MSSVDMRDLFRRTGLARSRAAVYGNVGPGKTNDEEDMTDGAEVPNLRLATTEDIDDILALLHANETSRGGTITGHFHRAEIAAAVGGMPVVVARRGKRLAGVLISSSIAAIGEMPVVAAMLRTYRGTTDAYIYGPICIDADARGQGLAGKLLAFLKRALPGREGILFIRSDNAASLRAHRDKLGMTARGTFSLDGVDYAVLSYEG
jgi:GNAT superfamily N-acetyltransferase